MEPEITPEQKAQLATWVGKRDFILSEISNLQTTKENLEKRNKELAESNSEIESSMGEIRGRISELFEIEKELPLLTLKEISSLQSQKTGLESEISSLSKMIVFLKEQKKSTENDVEKVLENFNSFKEKSMILDSTIGKMNELTKENERVITVLFENIKRGLEDLLKKNNIVTEKANGIISELPKVFLEVQRKSLSREIINKK